jgi:hypothetical protein
MTPPRARETKPTIGAADARPTSPAIASQIEQRSESISEHYRTCRDAALAADAPESRCWFATRVSRCNDACVTGRRDRQLTGASGEFLVAGELARRDWVPTLTPRGVQHTDVLARHAETGRMISVQVKTGTTAVFRLSNRDEQVGPATAQWYVFVRVGPVGSRPDFYVVPALVISALIYVGHRSAMETPSSRTGEPKKDTAIRACKSNEIGAYQEQWELLHADPSDAPVHLPKWVFRLGNGRIGWPPDHPGLPPEPAE